MAFFKKKPVVIEAIRFDGENYEEVAKFTLGGVAIPMAPAHTLLIKTIEGDMLARAGDWIIRGVAGEFYPCKPKIFEATYEPVP